MVPALIIIIPADYPCSSPESDLPELYDSTPFLREVKKRFVEEMVSVSGEYTLSHLLTCTLLPYCVCILVLIFLCLNHSTQLHYAQFVSDGIIRYFKFSMRFFPIKYFQSFDI